MVFEMPIVRRMNKGLPVRIVFEERPVRRRMTEPGVPAVPEVRIK